MYQIIKNNKTKIKCQQYVNRICYGGAMKKRSFRKTICETFIDKSIDLKLTSEATEIYPDL